MPTTRNRRLRRWKATLNPGNRVSLLIGPEHCLLAGSGYYAIGCNNLHTCTEAEHAAAREAMAKDWAAHGEALTEWWVAAAPEPVGHPWEHVSPGGPGTRPWGWWEFSCPGARRKGEAEATALARLGVLTADERARMRWKR